MINRLICVLLSALLMITIAGCGGAKETEVKDDDELFFLKKEVSLDFEISDKVQNNPFMGFAPEATEKAAAEKASLVYVDVTFRELQPKNEDEFDFEAIENENNLKLWEKKGKHVVFRFVCDIPNDNTAHMDIPDWLYEKINGDGTKYDMSYGKGFSPNYNNEIFIEYHAKAIKALGERFGKDNFFSYVELGSLGHWGEWHVNYETGITRMPKADVREKYVVPYIDAFPNSKILMRRPFDTAETHNFGVFNDMAGDKSSTDEWLDWIENGGDFGQALEKNALSPMPDAWKTAPIGGEFNSSLAMDFMLKTNIQQTADMIGKSHTTFLGPKCPISSKGKFDDDVLYQQGMDKVLLSMGYRIGIKKAEISKINSSGIAQIDLTWTNEGVAPLYFNLPSYVYILDENDNVISRRLIELNLREILPGKTIKTTTKMDFSALPITAKICVGIVDPLINAPAVLLSNELQKINNMSLIYSYEKKS